MPLLCRCTSRRAIAWFGNENSDIDISCSITNHEKSMFQEIRQTSILSEHKQKEINTKGQTNRVVQTEERTVYVYASLRPSSVPWWFTVALTSLQLHWRLCTRRCRHCTRNPPRTVSQRSLAEKITQPLRPKRIGRVVIKDLLNSCDDDMSSDTPRARAKYKQAGT